MEGLHGEQIMQILTAALALSQSQSMTCKFGAPEGRIPDPGEHLFRFQDMPCHKLGKHSPICPVQIFGESGALKEPALRIDSKLEWTTCQAAKPQDAGRGWQLAAINPPDWNQLIKIHHINYKLNAVYAHFEPVAAAESLLDFPSRGGHQSGCGNKARPNDWNSYCRWQENGIQLYSKS